MAKMLNILYHIEPIYRLTKNYQLEKVHVQAALKIADEICEEKKALREPPNHEETSICDDGLLRKQKSFIRTLLDPKHDLSDQEVKDEINTLIAAVSSNFTIPRKTFHIILFEGPRDLSSDNLKRYFDAGDSS